MTPDCEPDLGAPLGPSGRLDHFRPVAAEGTDSPSPLVVGPSGQVWSMAGQFPELVGTLAADGRVRPLPCALTPDQRAHLESYTRADLRPLPVRAQVTGAVPDAGEHRKNCGRPRGAVGRRLVGEMARRHAAGATLATLAAECGLTPSGVHRAIQAYEQRQGKGAVA